MRTSGGVAFLKAMGHGKKDRSQVRVTRSQIAPLGPPSGPSGAQVPGIILEAPGIDHPCTEARRSTGVAMTKRGERRASAAIRVEAPGIDHPCTEARRSTGVAMTKRGERRVSAANMVEAPGIEPGSENHALAASTCVSGLLISSRSATASSLSPEQFACLFSPSAPATRAWASQIDDALAEALTGFGSDGSIRFSGGESDCVVVRN